MHTTWFTPQSAAAALPRVRRAAERARELYRAMRDGRGAIGSDRRVDPCYFDLVLRLHESIGELGRIGVRVGDLQRGRVEFPASREGRAVWLCWQVGDGELAWWREADDEAGRRRPLEAVGGWDEPRTPW